jgi:IclR family transcriptional regulator, KDG regulon repressor
MEAREKYNVRAVQRALDLLRAFLSHDGGMSAAELGKQIDLGPSTVFRMLVTLESQGFVEQDPATGKYRPGVSCLELGSRFLKNNDLRSRAIAGLEELRNEFGETVHLTILQGNEVVYLEKLAGLHPIGFMSSRVGDRAPAHCTGVGKALLAHLSDDELLARYPTGKLTRYTEHTITDLDSLRAALAKVRDQGYAIDQEEHELGVKCVAVPTFNHLGIVAAMSLSGPVERMDHHISHERLIARIQRAAMEVSTRSGWGRGVDQLEAPKPDSRNDQRSSRKRAAAPAKERRSRRVGSAG